MFVRSSGEGAAKMHVSRFDVLVTLAYVTSTLLWVVVPVGWRKTSTPPCHRPPRIERRDGAHGRTRTAGLLLTKDVLYRHGDREISSTLPYETVRTGRSTYRISGRPADRSSRRGCYD